jgi:hypothetical protein
MGPVEGESGSPVFWAYTNYDSQFFSIEMKQKVAAKGFCIPVDYA